MATTEHTINDAIAQALRLTRHGWHTAGVVRSENTGMITGNNKRPDILVTEPGVSPVVISTAYTRLGQYFELNGGNSEKLHPEMMGSVLVGADVPPAAAHLTAAMFSGAHSRKTYTDSHIMTLPYGAQAKGKVALGSLDLLANEQTFDAVGAVGLGAKRATEVKFGIGFCA